MSRIKINSVCDGFGDEGGRLKNKYIKIKVFILMKDVRFKNIKFETDSQQLSLKECEKLYLE